MAKSEWKPGLEETIESPPLRASFNSPPTPDPASPQRHMALVEGSGPELSQEMRSLLRDRLRTVAILLFLLFAVFLVRSFWQLATGASSQFGPVFYAHITVTAVLALMAQRLCTGCDLVVNRLRLSELTIIGSPAAFFLLLTYHNLLACAAMPDGHSHVPRVIGGWILLIFCYALFVPNTWQRAAVVLSLIGIAPTFVWGLAYLRSEQFANLTAVPGFRGEFFEQFLIIILSVFTATVGVHTIGSLRKEAFVARQLGQYRLREMLGSGGMGEVYLAEHQMMKRPCAIKVIRPEKAGNPQVLARFEREVRATAKLSHWNSIEIYDYGRTDDGTFYYVMEFLPGHNIGELVDDYGPMPSERIVHLMGQVCDALAEAHSQGLVHRDIKPANIFCAYRGGHFDVAKLLDFGLAKPIAETQDVELTQEGAITGSPLFMSPEQATGSGEVDARSDIYSLGALMFYMATGQPPFNYNKPIQVMVAHASEPPQSPRKITPDIPLELEEIILRCLEKKPENRIQEATTLRDLLAQVPSKHTWSHIQAAEWWQSHGCPKRKALAAAAIEMAAV
ncbi:MAG: serine/threonine protein kinase [Planctomycetes bacterium]|nr:serine/threonine protein kinase [Planctomycetota bacterium]